MFGASAVRGSSVNEHTVGGSVNEHTVGRSDPCCYPIHIPELSLSVLPVLCHLPWEA